MLLAAAPPQPVVAITASIPQASVRENDRFITLLLCTPYQNAIQPTGTAGAQDPPAILGDTGRAEKWWTTDRPGPSWGDGHMAA